MPPELKVFAKSRKGSPRTLSGQVPAPTAQDNPASTPPGRGANALGSSHNYKPARTGKPHRGLSIHGKGTHQRNTRPWRYRPLENRRSPPGPALRGQAGLGGLRFHQHPGHRFRALGLHQPGQPGAQCLHRSIVGHSQLWLVLRTDLHPVRDVRAVAGRQPLRAGTAWP